MARIENITGEISTILTWHKEHCQILNLEATMHTLKKEGRPIKEYALKKRCDFIHLKYE